MNYRLPLVMLGLLLVAGFGSLGRWQWQRGLEKQAMLEASHRVLSERIAVPLAQADKRGTYEWAAGSGRFLAGPVMLLDNQRRGDTVGVRVFLPFQPDAGAPVLVDMGWLPLPPDRRLPKLRVPDGPQHIAGLLAPPPSPGIALGSGRIVEGEAWLLTRVDLRELAASTRLPLARRVLRLDPALPLGYPRDLDLLVNTLPPERHRGYALQWSGLALATLVITLFLGFRRRP